MICLCVITLTQSFDKNGFKFQACILKVTDDEEREVIDVENYIEQMGT